MWGAKTVTRLKHQNIGHNPRLLLVQPARQRQTLYSCCFITMRPKFWWGDPWHNLWSFFAPLPVL